MDKIKKLFCAAFRHSNIEESCFGYIHCARCGEQKGDTLAGCYKNHLAVGLECACEECSKNLKSLTWVDRFLAKRIPWEGRNPAEYRADKKAERDRAFAAMRAAMDERKAAR